MKGGRYDWDGQYDAHVWTRGVYLTMRSDHAAYQRAKLCHTHPQDIGNLHVIDFYLARAVRVLARVFKPAIATWPTNPARDADAEDFHNGDRHQ